MSLFRFEWKWPSTAPAPACEPGPVPSCEPAPESPQTICGGCLRGQVLRGFGPGQDAVYCNLTGVPWFVPFAVSECNEFMPRRARRAAAGFLTREEKEVTV